jgi:hypothetical protein
LDGLTSGFLTAFSLIAQKQQLKAYAAINIAPNEAIADLGATQIFVMEGTPDLNKQKTTCPLKVALADGCRVLSTHMCDIVIPGLPTTLVGHILPESSIASLFRLRVLTEAGCTVNFDNKKCVVKYNGKTILVGIKDPTTDLWTLLIIGSAGKTTHLNDEAEQDPFVTLREEFLETTSKASFSNTLMLAVPVCASAQACPSRGKVMKSLEKNPPLNQVGFFTHAIHTKANIIKFAHQSLCSPCISTLLKAIRRGFLKGCPNLTAKGVTRYLNPSPATAKGHMKRPHQGICSTTPRQPQTPPSAQQLPSIQAAPINNKSKGDDSSAPQIHIGPIGHGPNYIVEDEDSSIGNIFCFGAFAD